MPCRWKFGRIALSVAVIAFLGPQYAGDRARAQAAPAQVDAKPYKPVTIVPPVPLRDPDFDAFRKRLAAVAESRDRAALARLIVAKGFFWEQDDGAGADKTKSAMANFAAAIGLDLPDDPDTGWDMISIYADDATVFDLPERKGVVCGPADPGFDDDAFQALLDSTQTDVGDWIYPTVGGLEVRTAPRADATVSERIGLYFIRVLPLEEGPTAEEAAAASLVRVMTPSGKIGYVKADGFASLGVSQFCYVKDEGAWKITGVIGGVAQ